MCSCGSVFHKETWGMLAFIDYHVEVEPKHFEWNRKVSLYAGAAIDHNVQRCLIVSGK